MPIMHSDLRHHKGTTFELRGIIRKENSVRRLVENEDLLEFSISDADTNIPIIYKSSNAGIVVADDGSYTVGIPADEIERDILTDNEYKYAMRITEGDTTKVYGLLHGTLFLEDLPFAL